MSKHTDSPNQSISRPREFDDTREHLLASGESVIRGKGFAAVGLAEILSVAGVPKGSFYHYFRSKENFGVEMLTRYFEHYHRDLKYLLLEAPGTGRERLYDYFRRWATRYQQVSASGGEQCQHACLVVKLSAEVSDISEAMRTVLMTGIERNVAMLAEAYAMGQADGSLPCSVSAQAMSESLYQMWIGAELLTKVQRSPLPLMRALEQTGRWLESTVH